MRGAFYGRENLLVGNITPFGFGEERLQRDIKLLAFFGCFVWRHSLTEARFNLG
jgi:hypothetical protein